MLCGYMKTAENEDDDPPLRSACSMVEGDRAMMCGCKWQ
jgi:hypothetical protein